MTVPEGFIQLKYRRPGKAQMESTTVSKPDDWLDMTTPERRGWAEAECERVCPGATEVSLR